MNQNAYIRILKYQGLGFAMSETTRYSVYLVNPDTGEKLKLDDWLCESHGYSELEYAKKQADRYAKVLECKVLVEDKETAAEQERKAALGRYIADVKSGLEKAIKDMGYELKGEIDIFGKVEELIAYMHTLKKDDGSKGPSFYVRISKGKISKIDCVPISDDLLTRQILEAYQTVIN